MAVTAGLSPPSVGSRRRRSPKPMFFIWFRALRGPEYYYLHGSGPCKAQNTIIYMVPGLARPRILLFTWFWALQGPEYYYLHGSGPCKARNTIIYMVPGLARPGTMQKPNVFLMICGPCKA